MSTDNLPAEENAELRLEIAHVLLIDIVGYSRFLVNEQIEVVRELNRIVRNSATFRAAETADKLIRLPTGDGMALLFFSSPEDPAKCALEISDATKKQPQLQLRMGVHSGPVNPVEDVNDRSNIAGAGINIAQRVMDCGDAGHILLSKHVADDLAQYRHWRPFLHDLGECEVKHGVRLNLVNLFKDGLGNPQVPTKLRRGARWRKSRASEIHAVRPPRFPMVAIALAMFLSLAAVGFSVWLYFHRPAARSEKAASVPEKSIAVLPFENLSDNKQDAFFADGMQDEILTDLAKLADLKVISRTSVMQYRGQASRNLREIAQALGVNYALEGSVQRSNDRIRVSAQLIDARTDAHVWAEHYDRPVADVFAIQAEVAEKIVGRLQAKLSPGEKAAIEEAPTSDLIAFDFYVRASDLIEQAIFNAPRDEQLFEAIELLNKAIERDPQFIKAYFRLAHAHDQLYFLGTDHTPERLALADGAIRHLRELRPNSAEAHLATAKHLYWCYRDYDGARRELDKIGDRLPNDPWPPLLRGYMDRRQSRWDESTANLERALALDPQNFVILAQMSITYESLRRYSEAIAILDRALALRPDDANSIVLRGFLQMYQTGKTAPLREATTAVLGRDPAAAPKIAGEWLTLAEREHNLEEAKRALAILPPDACRDETVLFPRGWCEGRVAVMANDVAAAQRAWLSARDAIAKTIAAQPNYAEAICAAGVIDAALGRKAEAITESKRAMELVPVEKDALIGAKMIYYSAITYTLVGEKDLALQQLEKSGKLPSGVTYDDLLLEPQWNPLRSDPRFQKIVASLAPKN